MPVHVDADVRRLDRQEFGRKIADRKIQASSSRKSPILMRPTQFFGRIQSACVSGTAKPLICHFHPDGQDVLWIAIDSNLGCCWINASSFVTIPNHPGRVTQKSFWGEIDR